MYNTIQYAIMPEEKDAWLSVSCTLKFHKNSMYSQKYDCHNEERWGTEYVGEKFDNGSGYSKENDDIEIIRRKDERKW